MSRIAVYITKPHLGDAILDTAIVRSLVQSIDDCVVDVFAPDSVQQVFNNSPDIGSFISIEGIQNSVQRHVDLVRIIKERKYDAAIIKTRSARAALLFLLGGVSRRIGYAGRGSPELLMSTLLTDPVVEDRSKPRLTAYVSLLSPLGVNQGTDQVFLYPTEQEKTNANEYLANANLSDKTLLAIGPGASREYKQWPKSNFIKVLQGVSRDFPALAYLVITGPGETMGQEIVSRIPNAHASTGHSLGMVYE